MANIRKKVIRSIYEAWAEGCYPGTRKDVPEVKQAIRGIAPLCKEKEYIFVESEINSAMCSVEEMAFIAGFSLCMEFISGNIYKHKKNR